MTPRYLLLFFIFCACVLAARYFGEETTHENLPTQIETVAETKFPSAPTSVVNTRTTTIEFEKYADNLLTELPSPSELRKHKEISVHFTPTIVTAVAPKISKIQEQMQRHPELVATGLRFYEQCASHRDTFVAIRALCLHLHRSWVGDHHLAVPKEVTMAAEALRGITP